MSSIKFKDESHFVTFCTTILLSFLFFSLLQEKDRKEKRKYSKNSTLGSALFNYHRDPFIMLKPSAKLIKHERTCYYVTLDYNFTYRRAQDFFYPT